MFFAIYNKLKTHFSVWHIQSLYGLALEPTFRTFEAKEPVAPKAIENWEF